MTNEIPPVDLVKLLSGLSRIAEAERKLEILRQTHAIECIDALLGGQLDLATHHQMVDEMIFKLVEKGSHLYMAAESRRSDVAQKLIAFYTNGEMQPDEIYRGFILRSPQTAYSVTINPNGELILRPVQVN